MSNAIYTSANEVNWPQDTFYYVGMCRQTIYIWINRNHYHGFQLWLKAYIQDAVHKLVHKLGAFHNLSLKESFYTLFSIRVTIPQSRPKRQSLLCTLSHSPPLLQPSNTPLPSFTLFPVAHLNRQWHNWVLIKREEPDLVETNQPLPPAYSCLFLSMGRDMNKHTGSGALSYNAPRRSASKR